MNDRNSISQFEVIRQLRFPMIVLVTFAHSYSGVEEGFSLLTSDWNTYEFLKLLVSQTLVKVAVPVFFIISGYLFFANVDQWSVQVYKQKILRRIWTLLVPYLLWNILMAFKLQTLSLSVFWDFWCPAGIQIDWLGHEQWMSAPANMPLWFLRDLIVVSLFTPIIYIGARQFGNWLLLPLSIIYLSGICAFTPGFSAYAVFFFTLGACLSIRKLNLLDVFRHYEWPAYVGSLICILSMLFSYHTELFSSVMLCFRITGAVAVFCLTYRILSVTRRRIPTVVADSTYFIYLAHFVFFFSVVDTTFFSLFGTSVVSLSVHYILCPLLKIIIFVSIYVVYRWFKDYCRC